MINRRTFIQAGALTALPLAAGASMRFSDRPAARGTGLQRTFFYTVVYDERFADSMAFASEAGSLGLRPSAIRGDVTALWYDDLYHRWRQGPVAIAGLTTPDALFCLETLGNDAGLRLVMRAEHRTSGTRVEHLLMGPRATLQSAALESCGSNWAAHMAQLATSCPATRSHRMRSTAVSQITGRGSDQATLVSWVLAPLTRRSFI